MLNAAIVGLGWWGKKLTEAIQGSELICFTCGVTLEPELAADFCRQHGLKLSTSLDDLLVDPTIQAVVLATPHTTHRSLVEKAAAAGKHVFCEKPFALNKADAQAAIAACRRADLRSVWGRISVSCPRSRRCTSSLHRARSAPSCMRRATTATIGWPPRAATIGARRSRRAGPA